MHGNHVTDAMDVSDRSDFCFFVSVVKISGLGFLKGGTE
jgi:hypothetical protein